MPRSPQHKGISIQGLLVARGALWERRRGVPRTVSYKVSSLFLASLPWVTLGWGGVRCQYPMTPPDLVLDFLVSGQQEGPPSSWTLSIL